MMQMSNHCVVCGSDQHQPLGKVEQWSLRRCSGCGLEDLWPQPTDADLAQIYGKHYYDAWGLQTDERAVEELKKGTFRRRLSLLEGALKPGDRVLDLGCATGYFLDVAKEAGFDAYGVELSEFGASVTAGKHGRDRVHQGELADASFGANPGRRFQAVFMSDFIEHVRDPRAVLAQSRECLEPRGHIVITTPWVGCLSYRLMGLGWSQYKPEHLYYFSRDNLTRLLTETGFAQVRRHSAWKTMSLGYLGTQFARYPHPVVTPLMRLVRLLPARLMRAHFGVTLGDIVLTARVPQ